jgi:osmoprotectant transport system permease protein
MTPALAQEILQRSGEHLLLVLVSVALALLIALPLGLAVQGRPRLQRLLLAGANTVQTIPSLALFGLLLTVPLLGGIGPTPALVALTLYALLPLLRGLITGLQQVPGGLLEAGRALGLSAVQVLLRVQLPLALPSLMAGLRVATVISVGTATIAESGGAATGLRLLRLISRRRLLRAAPIRVMGSIFFRFTEPAAAMATNEPLIFVIATAAQLPHASTCLEVLQEAQATGPSTGFALRIFSKGSKHSDLSGLPVDGLLTGEQRRTSDGTQ